MIPLPLHWLLLPTCGLCGAHDESRQVDATLCSRCRERLELPPDGLHGSEPLRWWGAGLYAGALRELLLSLRRHPSRDAVKTLASGLVTTLPPCPPGREARLLLVPVPSWKRRANPLPGLLCEVLQQRGSRLRADLLVRSRPVLGQHHLGRSLRLANQNDAFRCLRSPGAGERLQRPVLIVDDILTSGATVCSAAAALRQAGWQVRGAVCLARTPRGRRETVI